MEYNTSYSNINIKDILEYSGIDIVKHGNKYHRLREHDSLVFRGTRFYWNSKGMSGNVFDLFKNVYNYDFYKTKKIINDFIIDIKNKKFIPGKDNNIVSTDKKTVGNNIKKDNNKIFEYLVEKRGIEREIVEELINNKTVEIDYRNNIHFNIQDKNGEKDGYDYIGTYGEIKYRGNTSEKKSGFNLRNNLVDSPKELYIFESPIDLISFLEMNREKLAKEHGTLSYRVLSLSGLRKDILSNYIDENIKKLNICVDNDEAGNRFCQEIEKEYETLKINRIVPKSKDWNDDLKELKNKEKNKDKEYER